MAAGGIAPLLHDGATRTESRLTAVAIRTMDIVVAAILIVLLLLPLLIVAIAIRLDSPGSVLFRQRRLGRDLKPFNVVKLRTMRQGAGSDSHRKHVLDLIAEDRRVMSKLVEDSRVTRVGSVLRRASLDELPQLWNVLWGQMSLVGPRPPIQYEVDNYPPEAFGRFAVKPGVTGLWQVSGRSMLTFAEMISLDLAYVQRRSVWLNLTILLRTLPVVVKGAGAA